MRARVRHQVRVPMRQWRPNIRNWLGLTRIQSISPSHKKKEWNRTSESTGSESTANAGDVGSIPGPGGLHMPWSNEAHSPKLLRLRLRSKAWEPQLLKPMCPQPVLPRRQATAMGTQEPQWRPSTAKNKEWIRPLVATWMDPEIVLLREVSETNIIWYHSHVEYKKNTNKLT